MSPIPCRRTLATVAAPVLAVALTFGAASARAQETQSAFPVSVSPAQPAEGDAVALGADLVLPATARTGDALVNGNRITLVIDSPLAAPRATAPAGAGSPQAPNTAAAPTLRHLVWNLQPLTAGTYAVDIPFTSATYGFVVRPRAARLDLAAERFQVTATSRQPGASPAAVTFSDASGYFSFFDSTDVEVTVKLLDGTGVNGHWWAFIASMTDTPFTITVLDTQNKDCLRTATCPTRTYTTVAGTNRNFLDTSAFGPAGGNPPGTTLQAESPTPLRISPAQPAEGDTITVSGDLFVNEVASNGPVTLTGNQISVAVAQLPICPQPPADRVLPFSWTLPPLAAGNYVLNGGYLTPVLLPFTVRPRATQLPLLGERFQVTAASQEPGGHPAAVPFADAGGYFTFFDPTNVELTLKMVDGTAVNGHVWVFIASMTDSSYSVTVVDTLDKTCLTTGTCPTRTYTNQADSNQNFIDTSAF